MLPTLTPLRHVLFFTLICWKASGQEITWSKPDSTQSTTDSTEIFTIVEVAAQPKGGMAQFYRFIATNMKFPRSARRDRVYGRVFIEFVIDKDGTIMKDSVRAIHSSPERSPFFPPSSIPLLHHPECEAEAVRVIQMAAPWTPGTQREKPVRQRMVIPIMFDAR